MAEDGWLGTPYDLQGKTVWVAGHQGMVGAAVCRALENDSCRILGASKTALDLREQKEVRQWMIQNKPDAVVLAAALVFLLKHYSGEKTVNVGSGEEVSIAELARFIAKVTDFDGEIVFDPAKPDGAPRKVMDSRRILDAGWAPSVSLEEGLYRAYTWYKSEVVDKKPLSDEEGTASAA